MPTQAYLDWIAAGKPYVRARPTLQLRDLLRGYGYTVYDYPDTGHQLADPPMDHTPYSATGWPVTSTRWVGHADDIMPDGPVELPVLARQIIADKDAGVPGTEWIKYINWTDENGDCWHTSWQPTKRTVSSTDKGHIHISGRSDMDTASIGTWDPVERIQDMTPSQGYIQHVMNYRIDGIRGNKLSITVPAYKAPTGETFPGFTEPNNLAIAITKLLDDEANLEVIIKQEIDEAVAAIAADVNAINVDLTDEEINEIAVKTAAGVTTTIDVPTAEENAVATVQKLGKEITN